MAKKMKKKSSWVTKSAQREAKMQDKGVVGFMKVQRHFFKEFNTWIEEMEDPRNESYITYTPQDLVWLGVMKNACGVESMRQMNEKFNEDTCIKTISFASGHAAKRLLARIKQDYPRLKICVQGDGLYGVEPIMKICREYGWAYIFSLKEGTQKNITRDYNELEADMKNICKNLCAENGTGKFYNAVDKITGKDETFNVFEYSYENTENENKKTVRFLWVTNIQISKGNLEKLIFAGRNRWKIENEGFNNQKNGIYQIEHLNSKNTNAMKNHYLLTQIADILMQLYLATNKLVKAIGQSIKNTSSRLLESFRTHTISDEDVNHITRYTTIHLE